MSVLSNFTTIKIINKTPYFITITCDAEQDDKFSVKSSSRCVVTQTTAPAESYLEMFVQYFTGVPSKRVMINVDKKETVEVGIRSKADLQFEYSPKIEGSFDHISGEFTFELSEQCGNIVVELDVERGIAYDIDGNVCILGQNAAESCDLLIKPSFKDVDKKPMSIDTFTPSICKLLLND